MKIIRRGETQDAALFILANRGSCTFTTKVRNIEKAGASMAIVIDNSDESVDRIHMRDDGTGLGIRIPSLLISKRDGNRLVKYLDDERKIIEARKAKEAKNKSDAQKKKDDEKKKEEEDKLREEERKETERKKKEEERKRKEEEENREKEKDNEEGEEPDDDGDRRLLKKMT